ncbi:MAG TPA: TIGR00282 family metallophosphoesterase [bacterium]|jgi:metallophosphoesterase (TIGR00282 family)|nr:TIGR00282 family metallophosphoesterase [bacterium]
MKFLLIGDVVAAPGRKACSAFVRPLKAEHKIDLVMANVENLAGGFGVNSGTLNELKEAGVDVFSSGNHIWDKKEVADCWAAFPTLLRPCNYPSGVPGRGETLFTCADGSLVGVVNVMGRVFMPVEVDDPFPAAKAAVARLKAQGARAVIVDMHAEATSEKVALWRHLDGEASVVVGTHTHVPTADARVSARGTAYLSDLGLTGGYAGVIGMAADSVLRKFLLSLPARHSPEEKEVEFWALLVETDAQGRALSAKQISSRLPG